jgi:hypothetical protein
LLTLGGMMRSWCSVGWIARATTATTCTTFRWRRCCFSLLFVLEASVLSCMFVPTPPPPYSLPIDYLHTHQEEGGGVVGTCGSVGRMTISTDVGAALCCCVGCFTEQKRIAGSVCVSTHSRC